MIRTGARVPVRERLQQKLYISEFASELRLKPHRRWGDWSVPNVQYSIASNESTKALKR